MFSLSGQVVIVTGGAGLLGSEFCQAVGIAGGVPVMVDNDKSALAYREREFGELNLPLKTVALDLRKEDAPATLLLVLENSDLVPTSLINNVAANPPMFTGAGLEQRQASTALDFEEWDRDLMLNVTVASNMGMFYGEFFNGRGGGSIVNIASDLALISPDQRIYRATNGEPPFPTKPLSYSVGKSAIVGLTRYLATYWSPTPVRCNALALGSVMAQQDDMLVKNLTQRIPLGRLAQPEEYRGAAVFLLSNAASYMTGAIVSIDGGRTVW